MHVPRVCSYVFGFHFEWVGKPIEDFKQVGCGYDLDYIKYKGLLFLLYQEFTVEEQGIEARR